VEDKERVFFVCCFCTGRNIGRKEEGEKAGGIWQNKKFPHVRRADGAPPLGGGYTDTAVPEKFLPLLTVHRKFFSDFHRFWCPVSNGIT
jgi:hypothetical protein